MLKSLRYSFFFLAVYLFVTVLSSAMGADTVLTGLGTFLFSRFHLAALYIPFLLFIGGIFLMLERFSRRTVLILWLSPIPFITSAILFQVMSGNQEITASLAVIQTFGRVPAIILFSILLILELYGMVWVASIFTGLRKKSFSILTKEWFKKAVFFIGLEVDEAREETREKEEDEKEEIIEEKSVVLDEEAAPMMSPNFPEMPDGIVEFPEPPEDFPSQSAFSFDKFEETPMNNDVEINGGESESLSEKLDPSGIVPHGVVAKKKNKASSRRKTLYTVPTEGILAEYEDAQFNTIDDTTREGAATLEKTLKEFKIEAQVTGIRKGPVITMYELLPSHGVKISSIVSLQDNIALRLAANRVRIVAPIPGKHAVGIEVPNQKRAIVSFSSLVKSEEFKDSNAQIPVILGEDISGDVQIIDLTRTPHLLIAGATGSGKSVCVNSLISSILYSRSPKEVKMIMVDPKIVELKLYNDIPHLLTPVITEPKRALQALQWCIYEMERRYSLLDSQGVRDTESYNKRIKERKLATEHLPYIVVIVDEFADLMATSGKELESIVARLAAMSRAVGIHLVLATQRPSVDVITGLIKANFPSRIAFMVAGKTDSRIIIDSVGAEKLLGRGDMLFTSAWEPFPMRMQGAFLSEDEVERIADYVKTLGEPDYIDEEIFFENEEEDGNGLGSSSEDDPLYREALEIVVQTRRVSSSFLQRRLKIGYNRAARLVEEMERRGVVGPANGSKPRDLIHVPNLSNSEEVNSA